MFPLQHFFFFYKKFVFSKKMFFCLFVVVCLFVCFVVFFVKHDFFHKKLQNSEFLLKILTFILSILTLMSEFRLFS